MSKTLKLRSQRKRAASALFANGAESVIIIGTLAQMARGVSAIRAARLAREQSKRGGSI